MKIIQKGFTLIELMIVVAIIAILAAIAISQYQDYVIRSQVSEGSALADGMKSPIVEYINNHGGYPPNNAAAGLVTATSIVGNYVTSVSEAGGVITATYGGKANPAIFGGYITFSSVTHAGSVEWHCIGPAAGKLKQKWCPSSCTCSA